MLLNFTLIFVGGLAAGVIITTIYYANVVKCLAEQNVELFKELKAAKTREPWEDEGEGWKLGRLEEDE